MSENNRVFDDVLTIIEVASLLKLSEQHVRRLAEAGQIPGRKLGDRWRFSREALLRSLVPVSAANGWNNWRRGDEQL